MTDFSFIKAKTKKDIEDLDKNLQQISYEEQLKELQQQARQFKAPKTQDDVKKAIKLSNKIKELQEKRRIRELMQDAQEEAIERKKEQKQYEKDVMKARKYIDSNVLNEFLRTGKYDTGLLDRLVELTRTNPIAAKEILQTKQLAGLERKLTEKITAEEEEKEEKEVIEQLQEKTLESIDDINDEIGNLKDKKQLTARIVMAIPKLKADFLEIFRDRPDDDKQLRSYANKKLKELGYNLQFKTHKSIRELVFDLIDKDRMEHDREQQKQELLDGNERQTIAKAEKLKEAEARIAEQQEQKIRAEAEKLKKEFQQRVREEAEKMIEAKKSIRPLESQADIDSVSFNIGQFLADTEYFKQHGEFPKKTTSYYRRANEFKSRILKKGIDVINKMQKHMLLGEGDKALAMLTALSEQKEGSGIKNKKVLKSLTKRLNILLGSMQSGNNSKSIKNEIYNIADFLLLNKVITKPQHKSILQSTKLIY